jgi:endonuclease YncB( thermonuclease family)
MRFRPLWLLAIAAALLAGGRTMVASHDPNSDHVAVIDGDTLQLGGEIVQLYDIDAPELGQLCYVDSGPQPCGVEAALALRKLISLAEASFHCSPWQDGGDPAEASGVTVQVCETGERDVSLVMLHGGYSVALPGTFPDYAKAQQQAREAGLGLWHSRFTLPWAWREGERAPNEQAECNVKATTNDLGQRVYYVPTDPDYDRVAVDPAQGDAWFCSDEEARLGAWRRPGEDAPLD